MKKKTNRMHADFVRLTPRKPALADYRLSRQPTNEHVKDVIAGLPGQPTWALANMARAWRLYFPWDAEYEDSELVIEAIRQEQRRRKASH